MRRIAATLAVAGLLLIGARAIAGEKSAECKSTKSCSSSKSCCKSSSGAALSMLARLPADVPKMRCVVGDEVRHCPIEAEKLSKEAGKPVHYFIGDEEYDTREALAKAYAQELDGYLSKITTVSYGVGDQCVNCPMKAKDMAKKNGKQVKYRLACYSFDDQAAATKKAAAARKASDAVTLTMVVADKTYDCPMKAADASKACHKPVQYKVAQQVVPDQNLANILLALTKIEAAVKEIEPPAKKS